MAQPDVFALKNSGFDIFLLASVGTEQNGSALTMLSVLARLGLDPWTEASRLDHLPKPAVIAFLIASISQMTLSAQTLAELPATAARLSLMLPRQHQRSVPTTGLASLRDRIPRWLRSVFYHAS